MKPRPILRPALAALDLDIDEAAIIADLDAVLEREEAEMNAAHDELIRELEAEPDP
jgi:hypothetical protein